MASRGVATPGRTKVTLNAPTSSTGAASLPAAVPFSSPVPFPSSVLYSSVLPFSLGFLSSLFASLFLTPPSPSLTPLSTSLLVETALSVDMGGGGGGGGGV